MQTFHRPIIRVVALGLVAGLGAVVGAAPPQTQGQAVEIAVVSGAAGGVAMTTMMGGPGGPGGLSLPVEATGSGMIVGQVVDAGSGQPIAGAIVTIGGALGGVTPTALNGRAFSVGGGGFNVSGSPGMATIPRVMTDAEGRFAFRSVPKGAFSLSAQKAGYLDGSYGRHRPDGAARQLSLEDGERTSDVVIKLFRPATIAGTVVDDRSEPIVGVEVRAYKRDLVAGRRLLSAIGRSAFTDDRGAYRISSLAPGEYVIAVPHVQTSIPANFVPRGPMPQDLMSTMATPGGGGVSFSFGGGAQVPGEDRFVIEGGRAPEVDGSLRAHQTIYYPAATVVSQATPIAVESGEERSGTDIVLRLVPTVSVAGRLLGPDGPAANYGLHLVPSDTGDLSADPDVATTITAEDGSFVFLGVPAGQYVVQTVRAPRMIGMRGDVTVMQVGGGGTMAFQTTVGGDRGGPPPSPGAQEPTLFTATPVSVGGTHIDGLTITLREGLKISGRIQWEGTAERPPADRMSAITVVADPADGKPRANLPPARFTSDGQFSSAGLVPGQYLLRLGNTPGGWMLKSILANGIDVSENPLDVSSRDVTNVVVTLTDRISELHGTVRGSTGAADEEAAVIVFPSDNRAWMEYGVNARRMRMTRATKSGTYTFPALPAGGYFVIAIPDEVSSQWQDPRFLDMLSREATAVSVGEGGKQVQDLTTRAVRPIGGDRPAPVAAASTMPASWLSSDSTVENAAEVAEWAHGPYVADVEAPAQQARDTRAEPTVGSASIAGVVMLDDASGSPQPVRRARVSLRAAEQRSERAVMTDDEGRFVLSGLPPGRYSLSATKPSYVTGYFGARRPGRGPGAPLALAAGQKLEGLTLQMARGGVISGRALDENGQPFPGAAVRVMQYRTVSGERQLVPVPTPAGIRGVQTDDRGQYRIFGLMPGAYVVSLVAPSRGGDIRQLSTSDVQAVVADLKQPPTRQPGGGAAPGADRTPLGGHTVGFAPVYYPGTTVAAEAGEVTVEAGQEISGIDLLMRLVPTAKIQGIVNGPDGRPSGGATLLIAPAGPFVDFGMGSTAIARTAPDGTFSSAGLAPGRYTISARPGGASQVFEMGGGSFTSMTRVVGPVPPGAPPPPPPPPPPSPGKPLWAQQDVDVNGVDLSGITLTLQEGLTITGRMTFDGKSMAAPEDLTRIRLSLQPTTTGRMTLGVPPARIEADGRFTIEGVTPGTYRLNANIPSTGFTASSPWSMKSAVANGKDVLDLPLTVQPGEDVGALAITFTDQTTELSGTLMGPSGDPVSDLTILVFPTDRAHWSSSSRRMRPPAQPGSDGKFRVTGLPPGEYFLAAVTELEPNDWGDAGFMEQVAAVSIRITLGEGEKKVQDIKIAGGGPGGR